MLTRRAHCTHPAQHHKIPFQKHQTAQTEARALTRINNVCSQVCKERAQLQGENSERVLQDRCRQTSCHRGLRIQFIFQSQDTSEQAEN